MEEEGVYDTNLAFYVDPAKLTQERGRSAKRTKDRNEAEKDRRDRTNAILGKLADYLSRELTGNRKLDKCSILCLVVNYIRINKLTKECIKKEFSCIKGLHKYIEDMNDVLVEHFMMIREEEATLLYTTQALTDQFGHSLVDVIGHSMFDIIHPDDQRELARQFFSISGEERKDFRLRILDNTSKHLSDYQTVQVEGIIKQFRVTVNKLERVLLCHWNLSVRQPQMLGRELLPSLHPSNNAWLSCHDLEGRLTFSSSPCAMLTGFLPHETLGLSAYSLLHTDDLGAVAAMHNLYLQEGFSRRTFFRMKTKDQRFIRVANLTHLVTKWNKQPDYIVSLNIVLKKDEWEKLYKQQDELICSRGLTSKSEAETLEANSNSMDSPHSSSYYSSDMSPMSSVKSGGIVTISAKRKIHIVDTNPVKRICAEDAGLSGSQEVVEPDFVEEVCPKPEFLGDSAADDISVTIRTNIDSSQSTTSCPSRDNSQCLSPDRGDLSISTVDFTDNLTSVQQTVPCGLKTTTTSQNDSSYPPCSGGFDLKDNKSALSSSSMMSGGVNASQPVGPKTKYSLLQNINRSMASSNWNPQLLLAELQKPQIQPLMSTTDSLKIQSELFEGVDQAKLQSILSSFTMMDNVLDLETPDFSKQVQNALSLRDPASVELSRENDIAGLCAVPANGLSPVHCGTQVHNSGQSQLKSNAYVNEPSYLYGILPEALSLDTGHIQPTSQGSAFEFCSDRGEQLNTRFMYKESVAYQDQEKLEL